MERIPVASPTFCGNERTYLDECIKTGWVSSNGRFIEAFQQKFAEFCGSKYALACCNGTASLHLALIALGVSPGDEVVMPTLTYIATANAVRYCGATPVFVDSDPDTWNVDVQAIENAITPKTKAIIPVHLYGLACNMTDIMAVASRRHIPVVEDAAEAHGAKWAGKMVGSIGAIGSFSFFGNKIITCGEGGMLVTDDEKLYERMKLYRSQGVDAAQKRYWHIVTGYNYRMTNMQAAVGLGQLENVDWHLAQRRRVASVYTRLLQNELEGYVTLQKVDHAENHVYWMNSVILTDKVKKSRDLVMEALEQKGIEMRPVFYPMHIMPPFLDASKRFPVAERLSSRGVNLPSHALMDDEKIEYVVHCLKQTIAP